LFILNITILYVLLAGSRTIGCRHLLFNTVKHRDPAGRHKIIINLISGLMDDTAAGQKTAVAALYVIIPHDFIRSAL